MRFVKSISILFLSVAIGLVLTTSLNGARAQGDEDEKQRSLQRCVQGFQAFMSATVGFTDSIRTWDEIFELNSCYRADLDGIGNQLAKARRQIRAAYLRCEIDTVDRLIANYYKIDAELWFLRNAVDTQFGNIIENFLSDEKAFALQRQMQKEYSDVIEDSLLQDYFTEFRAKYRDRFEKYEQCPTFQTLAELKEKWDGIVEALQPLTNLGKEDEGARRERNRRENRTILGQKTPAQAGPRDGPIVSFDESLDLNLKIARLKVEPERNFEDLAQQFKDDTGSPLRQDQVQLEVRMETTRVSEELSMNETWTRYRVLYGDIADSGTSALVQSIDELIHTIPATVPSMLEVKKCSKRLHERQCK
ncbi:MAG: hypothetical protein UY05_C0006G0025 [Candidatus Peregrinibacteria bacterium GW2011_GWA2_47_7]|nr:MAG: hypothetical protein UY05_C0006G0025 [Candidatus Peregrinibacteria bacterium GW2011_GWA2_47_7]